ncbi:response regulator [Hungatella effluvii]|uniref:response regulator n=1 Tax=Hungatella effluvii TaxID=1096246 RepID=UPI0022E59055|nr:response regulator [Hungatella effluvii]
MEINLSYEQLNAEYSMLMSVLGASVSKHLVDEHFTCIWANDYYYELIRYPKPQYEHLFHNHCDEYFYNNPQSWARLTDQVHSALDQGKSGYSLYLPMIYPDGGTFWVRMQAVFTDEFINGYRVSYTTMVDVTDMMQARLEQKETRQDFDKMMQEQAMIMSALNISVSKHLIDEHYTCVLANEYYYKLIGYSKARYEELFHNHPDEFYANNPEGWELLTGKVEAVLENNGDGYEAIVPMKYEDGSSYWVKLVSFFTDEYIDGFRISYTVMTDVTELVRTKNEQEMLMSAMAVSISRHLMDEHFTVVWANEFYYRLIGYSKEDYEARFHNHCDEYFRDNETGLRIINEKLQSMIHSNKRSYEAYLPLKMPDGSIHWVKIVGFLTDEYMDGKQIAYTTMIDVTDLMQTQKERSIAYENIPGFIVRHRILPHGIVMLDASERIKDIFDVGMEDITAINPLEVLSEESRELIMSHFPGLRRGEPLEATVRIEDKHSRDRWFHIKSTCIDTISADPVYLSIFIDITDITELRELQRKLEERTHMLNSALEAAKYANAAKSDFLSRMSHDIRTPMNVITGMAEIADAHIGNQDRVKDCLQKIRLSSHHLLGLINDVLDMSKIENGNFSISMAPMCLPDEVQEIVTIVLPGIRKMNQRFEVYLEGQGWENFNSDALRIRQILLNLLSNASKFTPKGGRIVLKIKVQETENAKKAMLCFNVSDNGIGMSPEYLEQIFEPFTREKDSRIDRIEGSGLGMAITKRLTDLLGGTISVKSKLGEGTVFDVLLPMEALADTVEEQKDFSGLQVLLIDDDSMQQECAGNLLRSMGLEADCMDFEEAGEYFLTRWRAEDYDFIILGLSLAEAELMEKTEAVCRKIQGRVPLIVSAYDVSGVKEKAASWGVCGFIDKPLWRSGVIGCLSRCRLGEEVKQPEKQTGRRETEPFDFTGSRVLLVEDNELNREIALELLCGFGMKLEVAVNGREALKRFEESQPGYYSLILMDIQMPVMNGYEAARAIRLLSREDAKTVPILAMTADAFVEDMENTKAAGMNGHLAKPLDFKLLMREMEKYLRG